MLSETHLLLIEEKRRKALQLRNERLGEIQVSTQVKTSKRECKKPRVHVSLQLVSFTTFAVVFSTKPCEKVLHTIEKHHGEKEQEPPHPHKWYFHSPKYGSLIGEICKVAGFHVQRFPKAVLDSFFSHQARSSFNQCSTGTSGSDRWLMPSEISLYHINSHLLEALLPYQKAGILCGIQNFHGRLLLADDMGLGKTIQAIAIMLYYRTEFPALILCPASMKHCWFQSLVRWSASDVDPCLIHICEAKTEIIPENIQVLIVSYDIAKQITDQLKKTQFQIIICDESHQLKNMKSKKTKYLLPVIQASSRRILISGTPALSRPIELYPQIHAIDTSLFPSFTEYGIRYCDGKSTNFGWNFQGASNLKELQLLMEKRIMVRRRKTIALPNLPEKIRKQIFIPILESLLPASESTQMDGSYFQNIQSCIQKLSSSTDSFEKKTFVCQLFAETAKVKLPAILHFLDTTLLTNPDKFIVFCHHKVMIEGVSHYLRIKNIHYIKLDGSVPSHQRNLLVEEFQTKSECRVAVMSISVSPGLTLTAANTAIMTELYWNPGVLLQAEDRIHRIGQEKKCTIIYLLCQQTVDDCIWPLLRRKLQVLKDVGLGEAKRGQDLGGNPGGEDEKAKKGLDENEEHEDIFENLEIENCDYSTILHHQPISSDEGMKISNHSHSIAKIVDAFLAEWENEKASCLEETKSEKGPLKEDKKTLGSQGTKRRKCLQEYMKGIRNNASQLVKDDDFDDFLVQ